MMDCDDDIEAMNLDYDPGLLLKMNPPLRERDMSELMLNSLLIGNINWVETDHAPHTLQEKVDYNLEKPHASGIPVFPYVPHFVKLLREKGMSQERIDNITHNNINAVFGTAIKNTNRTPNYDLFGEYEFNAFEKVLNK
jgi:dihydroorotase-like cyclic amidohydrolase